MALYDTRFGLPQSMVDYLNQGLPSISGIFQPSEPSIPTPVEDEEKILEELYPQNVSSGGDGYSVYNPDPNMTRTSAQYSPYAYNRAMRDTELGTVSPNPDMYYPKESGLANLLNFVPYIGSIKRGIEFFKDKLPISRAGIFQNELLGGGFMLDNIGRIVSAPDKYNTPEGIMAGYNPVSGGALNFITGGKMGEPTTYGLDKSYDKRRDTIAKTLRTKYRKQLSDEDIEAALAGEYEGDMPINPATGLPTKLIDRLGFINQSQNLLNKKLSAADIIFNRKVEERREKAIEKQNQERIARETRQKAEAARKNQTYTGGSDRQNIVDRNTGKRDATGGDRGSKGASDRFSNKSGRGRTGY